MVIKNNNIELFNSGIIKIINKDIPQWKAVTNLIVRKEPFVKTTTQKIKRSANR